MTLNLHFSVWWLLLIPVVAGLWLMYTDEGTGGHWNFPSEKTFAGCGCLLIALGIAAGLLIARFA